MSPDGAVGCFELSSLAVHQHVYVSVDWMAQGLLVVL